MTSILTKAPCVTAFALALTLALATQGAQAQTRRPTSSGQLLQQVQPPTTPTPSSDLGIQVVRPLVAHATDNAPFPVRRIEITGNHLLPAATLHALVAADEGKTLTLNDLNALAQRITQAYHDHGYPLALAYVPAQTLRDGVVRIAVVEARYGKVTLDNRSTLSSHPLLATLAPLQSGAPVTEYTMERSLLLLGDIPGVHVNSVLRPGQTTGTSDLLVTATPAPRYTGTLGLDNFGSRYTGPIRLSGSFNVNSLLHLGDLLSASAISSGSLMSYGQLAYRYLLNGSGTTLAGAVSALQYRLGNGLQDLHAHGSAQTQSLTLSQPLIRNTAYNLYGQLELDHKRLSDRIDLTAIDTWRHSNDLTATLAGDQRDSYGVTNFNVAVTYSRLRFDNLAAAYADALGPRTQGSFTHTNLSISRLQQLDPVNALYAGFSAQWSNANLDSSEQFYVGGPDTLRGYDSGALGGAQGNLATLEYRHDFLLSALPGPWQVALFVDSGHVQPYVTTFVRGANGARASSAGAGLSWHPPGGWAISSSVAKAIGATPALLAARPPSARFWLSVNKAF